MSFELQARLSDPRFDAVAGEAQRLLYIELSAPLDDAQTPLPLNLGLVLDRSGSMKGAAIDCLKEAAQHIVRQLRLQDHVSVVAFNDEPTVLVGNRVVDDPAALDGAIDRLAAEGGTCLDGGIELGLRELRKTFAPSFLADFLPRGKSPYLNRVFVLTDGHNQHGDDARCLDLARQALREHVTFSTFGIGEEFNLNMLRDVANAGNGMLHHIPSASHIREALQKEMASIQAIGATRVRLELTCSEGVNLGDKDPVCLVEPAIVVQDVTRERNAFWINIGDVPACGRVALLVTLYCRGRAPGSQPLVQVGACYEGTLGQFKHDPVEIAGEWVTAYSPAIDPEIHQAVSRMAIYKQRQKAIAMAQQDPLLARTMLQNATELAAREGNEALHTVLQRTLLELRRDGRISDRTMIEGEVTTRTVLSASPSGLQSRD